jgi:hypothetical protein
LQDLTQKELFFTQAACKPLLIRRLDCLPPKATTASACALAVVV